MKTYENIIKGISYWYFYDYHIKRWTVLKIDESDYQLGNAEYYANKQSLINAHKEFNFKICVN